MSKSSRAGGSESEDFTKGVSVVTGDGLATAKRRELKKGKKTALFGSLNITKG